MTKLKYILLLSLSLVFVACTTSKSLYKKGVKLEEAGLIDEASEMYMSSLAKKNTNVNSQIALKKAGQKALNDRLDSFNKKHMLEDHDDAVFDYEMAKLFHERVASHGIKLELPSHYKDRYEKSLDVYKEELYKDGIAYFKNKNYVEAKRKFNKIKSYDPNYKDITNYLVLSFAEPLYNEGITAYNREDWRKAYGFFDQIYSKEPDFKDVDDLWKSSLEKGTFPVAITHFESAITHKNVSEKIHTQIVDKITKIDNPFVKIVDRENMDEVIAEQTLGLSGVVDEATAANVGKILGAKGLITGNVIIYKETKGALQKKTVPAFEAYEVTVTNPDTGKDEKQTKFKKTRYTEYYRKNEVLIDLQYKCISLETGEIIFSDVVQKTAIDEIHYAVFSGENKNLVPAKGEGPTESKAEYDALQELLNARKTIESPSVIAVELHEFVGTGVSKNLAAYLDF